MLRIEAVTHEGRKPADSAALAKPSDFRRRWTSQHPRPL